MTTLAVMFGAPGLGEIMIVLCVVLLLFGVKKVPTMAHSLGSALSKFKQGRAEAERELQKVVREVEDAANERQA